METSAILFIVLALLSALSLGLGLWLGQRDARWSWGYLSLGVGLLAVWTWLHYHPMVAVRVIPTWALRYLEGTAAVPIFMLILGILWSRSRLPRQRRIMILSCVLGIMFFLNGGMWMLQTTPQIGFAGPGDSPIVLQSQDFTCVPAACATALNRLGVPSTEAEMAHLTQTRPGTGSTLIRAMAGLSQRLEGTGHRVQLLEPTYEQLLAINPPMLTPLRSNVVRYRHMVVIIRVDERYVYLIDPEEGGRVMGRAEFEQLYTREVIAFERS